MEERTRWTQVRKTEQYVHCVYIMYTVYTMYCVLYVHERDKEEGDGGMDRERGALYLLVYFQKDDSSCVHSWVWFLAVMRTDWKLLCLLLLLLRVLVFSTPQKATLSFSAVSTKPEASRPHFILLSFADLSPRTCSTHTLAACSALTTTRPTSLGDSTALLMFTCHQWPTCCAIHWHTLSIHGALRCHMNCRTPYKSSATGHMMVTWWCWMISRLKIHYLVKHNLPGAGVLLNLNDTQPREVKMGGGHSRLPGLNSWLQLLMLVQWSLSYVTTPFASHLGDITKMWDLAPDFGSLITGGIAWQRGHMTGEFCLTERSHDRGSCLTERSHDRGIAWQRGHMTGELLERGVTWRGNCLTNGSHDRGIAWQGGHMTGELLDRWVTWQGNCLTEGSWRDGETTVPEWEGAELTLELRWLLYLT